MKRLVILASIIVAFFTVLALAPQTHYHGDPPGLPTASTQTHYHGIVTTAAVAPRPVVAIHALPGADRPALADHSRRSCGASCYHIGQEFGNPLFIGFNSDLAGYWLRSKSTARDWTLFSVSGTCTLGDSCFEARMVTDSNLEAVAVTCTDNVSNTFQLDSGSGHIGDVFEFWHSGGHEYISSRHCNDDTMGSDNVDGDTLELGNASSLYLKWLFYAA